MEKAILKKSMIEIYIHDKIKPNQFYNHGKVVVSKQPGSQMIFCVDEKDIIRI